MGAVHGKKALVVISNGKSTRANGYLDRLENELKQSKAEYIIFDKVGSNPTKPVVEEGGRFAKENGCDFIVAYLILKCQITALHRKNSLKWLRMQERHLELILKMICIN